MSNTPILSHEFITAPSFAELEAALFEEISAEQSASPLSPVVVMTGSAMQSIHLQRRLTVAQGSVFNVRFINMYQLAQELIAAASLDGADVPGMVPDFVPGCIVHGLVRKDGFREDYFNKLSGFSGFRRALLNTMTDLQEGNLCPDLIDQLQAEPKCAERLRCLLGYYKRYVTDLQGCGFPFVMLPAVAAEYTRYFTSCFGVEKLFIYGVYDFNQIQFMFVQALGRLLELRVFVPYVAGVDIYDSNNVGVENCIIANNLVGVEIQNSNNVTVVY